MPLKKTSILVKISLVMGMLGFILFVSLGSLIYWRVTAVLSDAVKKEHTTFADQVVHNIDSHFYHVGREFINISQDPEFKDYLLHSPVEIKEELKERLDTYSYTSGPWDILLLLDTEGNTVLSVPGEHPHTGAYSLHVLEDLRGTSTQLVISDFSISTHTDKPTVIYTIPIFYRTSTSKEIVGYLFGEYSWAVLEEDLIYLDIPVYLVNSKGELLASNSNRQNLEYLQSFADILKPILTSPLEFGFDEVASAFTSSKTLVLQTFVRQKGHLSFKGSDWILILESPLDKILAPARYTASTMVVILAFATGFLILLLNAYLRGLILKPIQNLYALSLEIIKGDYTTRAEDVSRRDELGSLARVINLMLDKLVTALEVAKTQSLDLLKFAQVIKHSTEGIIIADADQKVLFTNESIQKLTGLKPEDILGEFAPAVFLHASNDPKITTNLNDTIISGKAFASEDIIFNHTEISEGVEVGLSIYPVIEKGKILFYAGLCENISERKRIDKAKSEFVSLASHQLRTPLTTIRWYVESLLQGSGGVDLPSSSQRGYLDTILESNYRMIDLVSALLNVSRIELGSFSITPVETDLPELANSVLEENTPMIQEKSIEIVENYQKGLHKINLDPNLMLIVLQNLITNAVKYTPYKGTLTISIAMDATDENLLLSVKDTGYGIPDFQKDKIFTKLFRADNIKTHDTTGTGLGLYISKSIIEHSGGSIWFESTENIGSEFFVKIPRQGMQLKEGEKELVGSKIFG